MEALEGFSRNGESAREDFKLLVSERRDRWRLWRLSGGCLEDMTGPPVAASVSPHLMWLPGGGPGRFESVEAERRAWMDGGEIDGHKQRCSICRSCGGETSQLVCLCACCLCRAVALRFCARFRSKRSHPLPRSE